ncbi:Mycothiol acetyltransferase [Posidoniimonas polymericola]|uniref:Mycothiol acetyltransferase n=1 Tax=Posidoniimonas polymericola TaxID=2528002 RepID=A0A5C5YLY3_9BACT|nr:GNAT family N-acetyltransferase [Posidoniimonas polymericola]TWT75983.1 Mycothiol acetyltransferase [Posidoniimonas polymericola]
MLRAMLGNFQIDRCGQSDLREALTLVLRSLPADQRAPLVDSLAKLRGEPLGAFDALLVAKQSGKIAAAAWGQPQSGKGCSLWPPQATSGEPSVELSAELIQRVTAIADKAGVALIQTLAEHRHGPLHAALVASGFVDLAELRYLQWKPQSTYPSPPAHSVSFEPFDDGRQARLERITSRTYLGTLDFPELDGMREVRDVLHGYKSVGEYDPELWSYIRSNGEDVGVLLLAEHPDSRQLELVYVGVAPEARGRGLGVVAVSEAQRVACERRVLRLVLAVDARNKPAQDIYHRAGLREWARRHAYLRKNGAPPPVG